jgi:hypothetical protein
MRSVPLARVCMALALGTLAVGSTTVCGGRAPRGGDTADASRTIDEVLAAHTDSLMALPGVVGTAIGLCDRVPCIRVFLADSSAATQRRIPAQLEGYRVSAEVTGAFRAREAAPGRPPP